MGTLPWVLCCIFHYVDTYHQIFMYWREINTEQRTVLWCLWWWNKHNTGSYIVATTGWKMRFYVMCITLKLSCWWHGECASVSVKKRTHTQQIFSLFIKNHTKKCWRSKYDVSMKLPLLDTLVSCQEVCTPEGWSPCGSVTQTLEPTGDLILLDELPPVQCCHRSQSHHSPEL